MMDVPESETVQTSKVDLYRGLIALAWADHTLHADEKRVLRDIIGTHRGLTDADRALLISQIDQPLALADVWPAITCPQDRARLIDMSNIIFQQDGDICEDESGLMERFQAKHLASVDVAAIASDLSDFSREQAEHRTKEREQLKVWASQYSLIGRLKAIFA